ncbi:MAG: ABC transporter substrate-binding protein [Clostridia bacterium]|nr:ABC transporter substrate-binding protein [Clostridia bacterium]
MKRYSTLLLSLILALALLTACTAVTASTAAPGSTAPATVPSATTAETVAPAETSLPAFPVTVTDQLGRSVTLEQKPERLVSGYYISSSLLIALDLEDQLVGIEAKASQRPIYAKSAPQLLDLPNVGTAKDFSIEGTLALEPDLVILPARLKDAIETLAGMGIPVLAVNPENGDLLAEAVRLVGAATGTTERAEALLAQSAALAQKAQSFAAAAEGPAQRVYLAGNSTLLSTAGPAMYQSTLLTSVGADNVAADIKDTYWAEISFEQLLAWQPDLIVLVPEASYSMEDVLADPALADLTAVKNNQVYQMPKDYEAWDSPVPSGVLGQLYLASILYPDQYTQADFEQDVADFYEEFYGF